MKNAIIKARELRRNMTPAEAKLWQVLRYQKTGHKFRRQQPIDYYIADFCCLQKRLVVELDGAIHNREDQRLYDQERDEYLKSEGFTVLRFTNDQVDNDLQCILNKIRHVLCEPSPLAGEGS